MTDVNEGLIIRIRYIIDAIKSNPSLKQSSEGAFVVAILTYMQKLVQDGLKLEMMEMMDYCEAKVITHLKRNKG